MYSGTNKKIILLLERHGTRSQGNVRQLLTAGVNQKIIKYSHHFEENSIKRNSLFIWEASKVKREWYLIISKKFLSRNEDIFGE
jgi:hypothetical protein